MCLNLYQFEYYMADTNKNHIPQEGARLKQLRQQSKQKQTDVSSALENVLRPFMRAGFVVQQPDISKLELEETTLDIPKMLAYAQVFNVDIGTLLKPHFQALCHSSMRFQHFLTDVEADDYLCEMEKEGRVLAFSYFPSSFFYHEPTTKRYKQIARSGYPETQLYAVDAFLNFLFSPISRFSYQQKLIILDKYLNHFRGSRFKHLHFFSSMDYVGVGTLPNVELVRERSTLLMLAPMMQQQGKFLMEINQSQVCQQVFDFFFHQLKPLDADITLIKIGIETITKMQEGMDNLRSAQFFYQEVLKRSSDDASSVLLNFSQDLQRQIVELAN